MKKLSFVIIPFSIGLILLQGCNGNIEETKPKVNKEEVVNKLEVKTPDLEEEVKPVTTDSLEESLNVDEFNRKFKQDPDENQYPEGKFQLKDGSIVNADNFNYSENNIFDYASVIFKDGELAHIQVDTESSIEEIENGIGIPFKDARVEEYKFGGGYEIIFDETFADENIKVFPNEWDWKEDNYEERYGTNQKNSTRSRG